MSAKYLFLLLDNNYLKLFNVPINIFQIEKREINNDYQVGYEYLIFFSNKTSFLVGETEILEDNENTVIYHCLDYYQENEVNVSEVFKEIEKLINFY
jgi:hypothetical protein